MSLSPPIDTDSVRNHHSPRQLQYAIIIVLSGLQRTVDKFEIDLRSKRVDANDFDMHVIAEAEFAVVAAAFDHVFFFVVVVVVVG